MERYGRRPDVTPTSQDLIVESRVDTYGHAPWVTVVTGLWFRPTIQAQRGFSVRERGLICPITKVADCGLEPISSTPGRKHAQQVHDSDVTQVVLAAQKPKWDGCLAGCTPLLFEVFASYID